MEPSGEPTNHADVARRQIQYKKRRGTTGVKGQLYETKLISLVLYNILNDKNIKHFYLGTNIDGVGDIDDICLRYELENEGIPRMLFIQAKHKEDTEATLSYIDLSKDSSGFNLAKYFDSYIKIRNLFKKDNSDPMFNGEFKDVSCTLVLFTPAKSTIHISNKDDLIYDQTKPHQIETIKIANMSNANNSQDYIFQIDNTDLVLKLALSKYFEALGDTLKPILLINNEKKYSTLMCHNLVLKYHVVLAQNVIEVSDIKTIEASKTNTKNNLEEKTIEKYREGKFRPIFFKTNDFLLKILRENMFKDIPPEDLSGYQNGSKTFKLPSTFGNIDIHVQKPKRIISLGNDFIKLFNHAKCSNKINIDNSIFEIREENQEKTLIQKAFVQLNGGIAGLVGNLLISDETSKMLKFNTMDNVVGNAKELLQYLLGKVDSEKLYEYRFNIKIKDFPVLCYTVDGDDQNKRLAKEFLRDLWFLTNQPMEFQVENDLKLKIGNQYKLDKKDNFFEIQSDAIYLNFHDKVQKWWLDQEFSFYLTKECNYLEESKIIIIDSPKLAVLDFVFMNKIKKKSIRFNSSAIQDLGLENFLNDPTNNILNIVTSQSFFTIIKLVQYFDQNIKIDVTNLDIEFIINENYTDMVESELESLSKNALRKQSPITTATTKVFVITCKNELKTSQVYAKRLCNMIEIISRDPTINIIVISKNSIATVLKFRSENKIIEKTDKCVNLHDIVNYTDLTENWTVTFQGQEVKFTDIVDNTTEIKINSENILADLINNQNISLGKLLSNPKFDEVKDYCITRNLNRSEESITVNTLKDIDEGVVVVVAEPGMGKSILLTQLALNTKESEELKSKWIVNINLPDYFNEFKRWKNDKVKIDTTEAIRFICKVAINGLEMVKNDRKYTQGSKSRMTPFKITLDHENICVKSYLTNKKVTFELKLFIQYYQKGNLIFMFDSFDEVCPLYEKEVLSLIKILTKSNHAPNCEVLKPIVEVANPLNLLSNPSLTCKCKQFDQNQKRLWITTRSYTNVKNALERELGIAAYTLHPFSKSEQTLYLKQFMELNLSLSAISEDEMINILEFFDYMLKILRDENRHVKMINVPIYTVYVAAIMYFRSKQSTSLALDDSIISNLREKCDEAASILESRRTVLETKFDITQLMTISENPLHLSMAAKYFLSQIMDESDESESSYYKWDVKLNSFSLFEHFIDTKFKKIRFEEIRNINLDNPANETMFEEEREKFIDKHKKLALCALFESSDLLKSEIVSKDEFICMQDTITRIDMGEEKSGFVDKVIDNVPRFVHLVFAEYFAIEYICDKLKKAFSPASDEVINQRLLWEFVMNIILYKNSGGVRSFFDHKLQEEEDNSDLRSIISSEESKILVFELLLEQGKNNRITPEGFNSTLNFLKTSLNIVIEESLFNVQNFFLECIKCGVNDNNLDEFIDIIADSMVLVTAFGVNNDGLLQEINDSISHVGRPDKLLMMIIPSFLKNKFPFSISSLSLMPVIERAAYQILPQLRNLDFGNLTLRSSLRNVLMDYIKLLWDLVTNE